MEDFKNLLSGRNRSFLMAFSILLILAFHFSMYGNLLRIGTIDFLFGSGYLGVDIFIFLSSYGLCFSLCGHGIKKYYLRRLCKLYPLYLFYLLAFFVFFYNGEYGHWLKVATLQITGMVSFTKIDIEWFIPALTILYLTFPLIFMVVEKIADMGIWPSCALVAVLSIISPILSGRMFDLFPPRFAIIIIGILSFLYVRNGNQHDLLILYFFCAILGLCFIGGSRINVSQTGSLLIPLLLFVLGQLHVTLPSGNVINFIGKHTLEIYLAQNLAFNHFMASSHIPFIENSALSIMIVLAGTMAFIPISSVSNKLLSNLR